MAIHVTRSGGLALPPAAPAPAPQGQAPAGALGPSDPHGWLASIARTCGALRPIDKET